MTAYDTRGYRYTQTRKRGLAILLLLMALIAPALLAAPVKPVHSAERAETNDASLWLDGPSQAMAGETISYDIRVDASGLYGLQLELSFDPSILQGASAQLTPGSCPVPDFVVSNTIDNVTGTVSYAATALHPTAPCDGGIVASLQFQVSPTAAGGNTVLQFANVILGNADGEEIPATTIDQTLKIEEEVAIEADFSGTPATGPAPLMVSFTNLSSGPYTSCNWSFGDGGGSTSCLNQSHTYTSTGSFTVSLTVSSTASSDSETRVDYIVVIEPAEQYDVYAPAVMANYP